MISSPMTTITSTAAFTLEVGGSKLSLAAIAFYNESPFPVRVQYGGSSQTIPAMVGDLLAIGRLADWDGSLLVIPQPFANVQASGACYYNAYGPGEPIPTAFPVALSRMQNFSSQARIATAAIPGGANLPLFANVFTGVGLAYMGDLMNGTILARTLWQPNQGFYLTYFYAMAQAVPTATGVLWDCALELVEKDVGGGVRATSTVARWLFALPAAAAGVPLKESFTLPLGSAPLAFGFTPNANTVTIGLQFHYISTNESTIHPEVWAQAGATVDASSGAVVGPMGNNAPQPVGPF